LHDDLERLLMKAIHLDFSLLAVNHRFGPVARHVVAPHLDLRHQLFLEPEVE
jgi:hypothetical protein